MGDAVIGTGDGAPAAPDYPSPLVGWTAVLILFVLIVLSVLDRNILMLLIQPIKADLGISDFQVSLLYGLAFALFYGVMALPAGWAIDRFDRRRIVFAGVMIWSLSTIFTGFVRSAATLFVARAGVGAGEAVLSPGQQSMLADLFPPDRLSLPLSISSLGLKVGGGAALIIGGALAQIFPPAQTLTVPLLGAMRGWQAIFIVVGVPGLLIGALIFLIPEPRRQVATQRSTPGSFKSYLTLIARHQRFFVGNHLGQLLFVGTSVAVAAWSPAFLARTHGWPETKIGLWLGAATMIGSVAGMPLHGVIVDRLFRRGHTDIHMRYAMLTALVGTPIGIAAFLVPNPELSCLLIGVFFFVICVYGSLPIVAVQIRLPSDMRGRAASIMLLIVGAGATTLGPMTVAAIGDFIIGDPARIGLSIAITIGIALPFTAILFGRTLLPCRRAARF